MRKILLLFLVIMYFYGCSAPLVSNVYITPLNQNEDYPKECILISNNHSLVKTIEKNIIDKSVSNMLENAGWRIKVAQPKIGDCVIYYNYYENTPEKELRAASSIFGVTIYYQYLYKYYLEFIQGRYDPSNPNKMSFVDWSLEVKYAGDYFDTVQFLPEIIKSLEGYVGKHLGYTSIYTWTNYGNDNNNFKLLRSRALKFPDAQKKAIDKELNINQNKNTKNDTNANTGSSKLNRARNSNINRE